MNRSGQGSEVAQAASDETATGVAYGADELELADIPAALRRQYWVLICALVLGLLFAIAYVMVKPPVYRATALLAPAPETTINGGGERFGGLAGIASLALGSSTTVTEPQRGIEVLRSRAFITDFIERRGILVSLFAGDSWDAVNQRLLLDASIYDEATGAWVRDAAPPRTARPSPQEAYELFSEAMNVTQNPDTGFITVTFDHVSPVAAKQWIDWLIADLNEAMRSAEIRQAQRSLEYLEQQLQQTSLAQIEQSLFQLVQDQHERMMLARVRLEYQFETIDPAVVPEVPDGPPPVIVGILIVVMMLGMGALFALVVDFVRRTR